MENGILRSLLKIKGLNNNLKSTWMETVIIQKKIQKLKVESVNIKSTRVPPIQVTENL